MSNIGKSKIENYLSIEMFDDCPMHRLLTTLLQYSYLYYYQFYL